MRLGALERLGIDYGSLHSINAQLVYCHSSGYGNDGPWSHLPTFEPLHSASTGVLHRTGGQGNPPLMYLSNLDLGCGLTSTICVLAALLERQRSGLGQYLEVPQVGAGLLAMSDAYLQDGDVHETFPLDAAQRGHALTNSLYPTADGWVLVCAYDPTEWEGVRQALSLANDTWPPFPRAVATLPGYGPDGARLDKAFAGLTTWDAVAALEENGVPCTIPTPLNRKRLPIDPLLRQLGVIVVEQQPDFGAIWEPGHGIRFSESAQQHNRPAPGIGQHSRKILAELGLSDDEAAALISSGVVGTGQPDRSD
jgi:crotonobetainyl-CoA:carnitine CoA-transferase CaiB-like acyl-CoA transferase